MMREVLTSILVATAILLGSAPLFEFEARYPRIFGKIQDDDGFPIDCGVSVRSAFDVLTNARGYRRWNSFTTSVRGRIDEGERVFLNVTLDYPFVGKIANEYPFLVTEMTSSGSSRNASAILCWSAQLVPEALQRHILNTRRCMRLKRDRDGIVRFMQWDTNRGFLSPAVGLLFGRAIESGFRTMAHDLYKKVCL